MAFVFSKTTPAHGAQAIYTLKEHLKSLGWTVTRSSDGTTFNASGDQITQPHSGAGGMHNQNSWFVIRQPAAVNGAQREIMIHRPTTNNNQWTIHYSHNAGFTGGAANAIPTATDGAGITPVTGTYMFTTDGMYRFFIGADNAAPYGFWAGAIGVGGTIGYFFFAMDPLVTGSYDPADLDNYVFFLNSSSSTSGLGTHPFDPAYVSNNNTRYVLRCWYNKGLSDQTFPSVNALYFANQNGVIFPRGSAPNYTSGKDDMLPIYYGFGSFTLLTRLGLKGCSTLFKWMGSQRNYGDTFTVSSTRDRICFYNVSVPWDGSIPVL